LLESSRRTLRLLPPLLGATCVCASLYVGALANPLINRAWDDNAADTFARAFGALGLLGGGLAIATASRRLPVAAWGLIATFSFWISIPSQEPIARASALAALLFGASAAWLASAVQRAEAARAKSLTTKVEARAAWSIAALTIALASLPSALDWYSARAAIGPRPGFSLSALAVALLVASVVRVADRRALRGVKRLADAEGLRPSSGEDGDAPTIDLGVGDDVLVVAAPNGPTYRAVERANLVVLGSLVDARSVLRRTGRISSLALAAIALSTCLHLLAWAGVGAGRYAEARCKEQLGDVCIAVARARVAGPKGSTDEPALRTLCNVGDLDNCSRLDAFLRTLGQPPAMRDAALSKGLSVACDRDDALSCDRLARAHVNQELSLVSHALSAAHLVPAAKAMRRACLLGAKGSCADVEVLEDIASAPPNAVSWMLECANGGAEACESASSALTLNAGEDRRVRAMAARMLERSRDRGNKRLDWDRIRRAFEEAGETRRARAVQAKRFAEGCAAGGSWWRFGDCYQAAKLDQREACDRGDIASCWLASRAGPR
jgi:hypothetical protein